MTISSKCLANAIALTVFILNTYRTIKRVPTNGPTSMALLLAVL